LRNPVFLMVCVLVAVTPLMRGSVHFWAQTVIQALVALGGIMVVVGVLRAEAKSAGSAGRSTEGRRGRGDKENRENSSGQRSRSGREQTAVTRKGVSARHLVWYVAVPCLVLGAL